MRRFLLTNKRLINFGSNKIGDKWSTLWTGTSIKRQISLIKIDQITVATKSNQFILHVYGKQEHDYNLAVGEERDEFIRYILKLREDTPGFTPIRMRFIPCIDLYPYTTFEKRVRNVPLPGEPKTFSSLDWASYCLLESSQRSSKS